MDDRTMTDADLLASEPRYVAALREAGTKEARIIKILRDAERRDNEIAAGRCPECGAPIRTYNCERPLPSWQDPNERGQWVMIRCSTQNPPGQSGPPGSCGFMLDRFAPEIVQ